MLRFPGCCSQQGDLRSGCVLDARGGDLPDDRHTEGPAFPHPDRQAEGHRALPRRQEAERLLAAVHAAGLHRRVPPGRQQPLLQPPARVADGLQPDLPDGLHASVREQLLLPRRQPGDQAVDALRRASVSRLVAVVRKKLARSSETCGRMEWTDLRSLLRGLLR